MPHNGDQKECIMDYPTLEDIVGNTPLVRLKRISAGRNNTLLAKLEGQNPAGSVKDRPAMAMLGEAQARGDITPGDTLIEATSGNTGIALAMAAAIMGYRMVLVMPESASQERKHAMAAYGATLLSASKEGGMEEARDIAEAMIARGEGKPLDQFANPDNPLAHYRTTGAEVWQQTGGAVTHFVSAMGTTGTIMGVSRYLKEQNPAIQIVGLQPEDGASIAGIRRWPEEYLPSIFDPERVDVTLDIGQAEAEEHMRRLAREEGILAGVSSGGSLAGALRIAEQVENAVIVFIVCDRGDRYLSTGLFAPEI
jgi:cysteine synthase B